MRVIKKPEEKTKPINALEKFNRKKFNSKTFLLDITLAITCKKCDYTFNLLDDNKFKSKLKNYIKCFPDKMMTINETINCDSCKNKIKIEKIYCDEGLN